MPLFRKKGEELYVNQEQDTHVPPKKQINLSDPNVPEVIALSPTTLLAKNKFFCEICYKGFPREQNLQLHKRGHNMPWKLKKRTREKEEMKPRKLFVCPESSCVHHDPSHALGDFSGIKKHYFRKHCEKQYKCHKCLKMYAIQSDLNAHLKTCRYQCHGDTLFSRCDAPAGGGGRIMYPSAKSNHHPGQMSVSLPQPIGTSSSTALSNSPVSVSDLQNDHKYKENSSDARVFTNLGNKNTSTQHDKCIKAYDFMEVACSRSYGNGEGSSLFLGKYDTTAAALHGSLPSSSSFTSTNLVGSATGATSEAINRGFPSADKPNSNVTELVNPFRSSGPNVGATYEQQHDGSGGGDHDDEDGFMLFGTKIFY